MDYANEAATALPSASPSPRQIRGLALVKAKPGAFRPIVGDTFLVPSASHGGGGGYVVDLSAGTCSCPDHEETSGTCKHQWALRYFRQEIPMPNGDLLVTEGLIRRKTYSQDWPAYNRSQCEEKERAQILLVELVKGVPEPEREEGKRGRPPLSLRDVIVAETMKVFTTVSGRRANVDIQALETAGRVEHAPAYNSLFKYMGKPSMTPILKGLVEESATPLRAIESVFAVDATGFSTSTYARWHEEKHGAGKKNRKKHQIYLKLHAATGVKTNIIPAVEITHGFVHDSPMLPEIVRTMAKNFNLEEVSADKAYSSRANLALIEKVGATPFVIFKDNAKTTGKSEVWDRLFCWFKANEQEFLQRYHQRSNVEATFSSVKRKFGSFVRSRKYEAQVNELLLKCLCHNLSMLVHAIHELDVDPKFWMPRS